MRIKITIPDELYAAIKAKAAANCRTLSQEIYYRLSGTEGEKHILDNYYEIGGRVFRELTVTDGKCKLHIGDKQVWYRPTSTQCQKDSGQYDIYRRRKQRMFDEKFIEDYICHFNKHFIETLKLLVHYSGDIQFVGRQVRLGNGIADLIYYFEGNWIVVELKNRKLEPKDLAQLSRYMRFLHARVPQGDVIHGVFVSDGDTEELKQIRRGVNFDRDHIHFLQTGFSLHFSDYTNTLITKGSENLKLDDRIEAILGGQNERM